MTDEEPLSRLIRASIQPVGDPGPRRDLWPAVVRRIDERRRLSLADKALIAAMLVLGPFFPRALLFLAYSL